MTDLSGKLLKWLDEQGYPLEMRVAQSLNKHNLQVRQSDYYIDAESGKYREIDVVASCDIHHETSVELAELDISVYIQCKSQQKQPWIVFTSTTDNYPLYIPPPGNRNGRNFARFVVSNTHPREPKLLVRPTIIGYGITQAFMTGKDVPFEAVMSATKAVADHISNIENLSAEIAKDFEAEGRRYFGALLAIPIVVIDGQLFLSYLDSNNTPVVEQTEHVVIEWKYPGTKFSTFGASLVHIFCESALEKLTDHVNELITVSAEFLPLRSSSRQG